MAEKIFEVRFGRSDVTYTIFAKDEDEASRIASEKLKEKHADTSDFYWVECEKSEWATEEDECDNYVGEK